MGRLRYAVGTAVLPATTRVRRTLRRPETPAFVPRPRGRRRSESPLRLGRVLVASDLNPQYLDFWPLVERAWQEVVGVDPLLVVVVAGDPDAVPDALREDERVEVFPAVPDVHEAFQAQCLRLLLPALLPTEDAVLVADIDLLPLAPRYFHGPLETVRSDQFVAYRDVLLGKEMLAISYLAARPATWSEIFDVRSPDDVRLRLSEWARDVSYDGIRGGVGWYTDQRIAYRHVVSWARRTGRAWILDDGYCGHRRLDRLDLERAGGLGRQPRRHIEAGRYSDYHCLTPPERYRDTNELVLRLALDAGSGR